MALNQSPYFGWSSAKLAKPIIPKPYQGPVPLGADEDAFRRTGETVIPTISSVPINQQQPSIPTPTGTRSTVTPQGSGGAPPPIDYSKYVDIGGTIQDKTTGQQFNSQDQLYQAMGLQPGQNIDYSQIQPGAVPNIYEGFIDVGDGQVVNTSTGTKYETPEQLAEDLGVRPDQIDWTKIKKATPQTNLSADAGDDVEASEDAPIVPPTYEVDPETQAAIDAAEKAYQLSLEISPEELSTQEQLDNLITATREGYRLSSNQPIALDFITGQMKAIEQRALGLAEPLESKLARLQAKRQSAIESSKFALERADDKADDERARDEIRFEQAQDIREFEEGRNQFAAGQALTREQMEQDRELADRDYQLQVEEFEENKRRYGQEFAEDKRRFELEYQLSQDKFNEDIRRFGLEYALSARGLALDEAKLSAELQGDPAISPYQAERSTRVLQSVDELLAQVDVDGDQNVGFFAKGQSLIPGTSEYYFAKQLETLKSNIAYSELTAMREASKTGGALGQVSDKETALLSSALGAVDIGLSKEQFIEQMERIRGSIERWQEAVTQYGGESDTYTDPDTGQTYYFNSGGGGTPTASGMRTDRHNNPTAFTTDVAAQAGLREGIDYERGDPFPNNPNAFTARLLGDPAALTRKVIDTIGFYTGSGNQRWSHTAMSPQEWNRLSTREKNSVIAQMYQREGNQGALSSYFA